nr:hypothetical protein [Tanacetum cinerariifolium]
TLHKEINTVNLIVGADPTIGLRRERPVYQETAKTTKMGRVGPQPFNLPPNLIHQKEDLHLEFPGPEERLVDFPEGKVDIGLFNLICALNPTKVKTGTRPRAANEVSLLTITASRVIEIKDPATATESSRTPSTIERSPLDFVNENPSQQSTGGDRTKDQGQETVATEVPPPKNVTTTGVAPDTGLVEEIAAMGPCVIKKHRKRVNDRVDANAPPKETPADGSDPDPLSFAKPQPVPKQDVVQSSKGAAVAEDPESKNTSFTFMSGSPKSIYQPNQYNINLARQVAMGSQLRLRFEQEAKLLKKSVAQVARRDQRIQARENEIKNLEAQVTREEKLKATFKEFKKYEDDRVEKHCAEMNARLDALSIDFDEELYPHMLTAIAGRRWVIGHGLRLAGMSEGLKYRVEHGKANLDLEAIEAFDPEADTKYVEARHALRDLKYLVVDQLESLKDALIDVIMASLHLEKVRDLKDPWSFKEEILLEDAIAANVSRSKKKKKWRVVCRTHRVGSAHHARSDGVPVSVPTVASQGLAILLADAATQTETSKNEASLRLLRICTCGILCAPWESSLMHLAS